jgi:hypothetical protein
MKKYIHQIYYDAATKNQLQKGFIPLDNTKSPHPDWFELWVILNFLRNNTLEEGAWYGFLSPKFYGKTGCTPELIDQILARSANDSDVILCSSAWDQLSYFLNPFEQGEVWHPGLLAAAQKFADKANLGIDLSKMVCDTSSAVFANYIIAKSDFWMKWKQLAEEFFHYIEGNPEYNAFTSYGAITNLYPMKAFIQERLACIALAKERYRVITTVQSFTGRIFTGLFPDNVETRVLLQTCDLMKLKYRQTSDEKYLDMYWMIRESIKFTHPN